MKTELAALRDELFAIRDALWSYSRSPVDMFERLRFKCAGDVNRVADRLTAALGSLPPQENEEHCDVCGHPTANHFTPCQSSPQTHVVLDLLLRLVSEGKRPAALRTLARHMVDKPDDGKRLTQSAALGSLPVPDTEALRSRLATLLEEWRAIAVLKRRDEIVLRDTENDCLADLIHEQGQTTERRADELSALLSRSAQEPPKGYDVEASLQAACPDCGAFVGHRDGCIYEQPAVSRSRASQESQKENEMVSEQPDVNAIWYGPQPCAICGVTIVKAAMDAGGAEFEPPDRLSRIFAQGSEAGDPDTVYPMVWKAHVHQEGGSPRVVQTSAPPTEA